MTKKTAESDEVKRERRMRNKNAFVANAVQKSTDLRISTCRCNRGIFPHHTYLWTSEGFVHTECHEAENVA